MELFYSTLREGSTILLKGGEAEHCAKVLRHKIGETVFVIDGAGGLYRCTIENIATEGERAKRGKKVAITIGGNKKPLIYKAVKP